MTTPGPETGGQYASDDRDWAGQPPAWSDFYTGPVYDDTGWFLDLSGVDWGEHEADDGWQDNGAGPAADPRLRHRRGRSPGRGSAQQPAFRFPEGNGGPPERGVSRAQNTRNPATVQGRPPRGYAPPPGGSSGKHARPDPTRPAVRDPRYADRGLSAPRPQPPGIDWRYRDQRIPPRQPPPPLRQPPLPEPALREQGARQQADETGQAALVRSSGVMAAGTLVSRLTGFLRTIIQGNVLLLGLLGSVYNLSNTLPNVVYNLALGGILTSVIVPLIVKAGRRDSDRGAGYDQRMFTLITAILAGVTLVAMVAAVPIVGLYSGSAIHDNHSAEHLAVIWALFFIPQIFFYGISSLIAAILNSRGSFAAPMWTPIINNFVVIAVLGGYAAMAGVHRTPATITGAEVQLLGLGTTLGIVAQTIALIPALRRVGFRWQPRLDFRHGEVREIGRMAGWMFGYIAFTQVAFLVTTRLAGDTAEGVNDYNYAWLLFQLPYAVVGISVITALLPRMSAHATERRFGLVRSDFSTGVRLASSIVVPCSLVLAALGAPLGELLFYHDGNTVAQARYVGVVFAVFCLGLTPYMVFQLQLRVFYSLHDSKTPAVIGLVTMAVNIVANLLALKLLPLSDMVAGLGAGFGLANLVGTMIAWRILAARLRGLDGWRIGRSLVRMHAATLPAALIAVVVGMLSGDAIVTIVIGGGLALLLYVLFARALRIDELSNLSRAMLGRFAR